VVERLGHDKTLTTGFGVFIAPLEAIVDRGADALEHIEAAVDGSPYRALPQQ